MRIRSIKPEFWSSEDIAALDWPTRLIFIGLWSYVDDNGVGRDSEKLIVADLFPLEGKPRETLARVSRALATLSTNSLITRYTVANRPYLHIGTWSQHQRIDKPGKPRYPLPTVQGAVIRDSLATVSRDPLDISTPGEGEQGSRGAGEQGKKEQVATDVATRRPSAELEVTRDDIRRVCEHLADRIEVNTGRRPTVTDRWRTEARLLLDHDGHREVEVRQFINWATGDPFWRANILSMPKFREKYDQLRLQAQRPANGHKRNDIDWDSAYAQAVATDEAEGNHP